MRKIKVRSDVPKEPAMIIENQLILTEGVWNGVPLSPEEIEKGLTKTDWKDKRNSSIYYGHDPKKTENWVGKYVNRRYLKKENGVEDDGIYADIHIYDTDLASKLAYGEAKFAVSQGMTYAWGRQGPYDLQYNHLGIVDDPGIQGNDRIFLNLEKEDKIEGERYETEIKSTLNLENDYTNTKGDKKMTEGDKVNKGIQLTEDQVTEIVKKALEDEKTKTLESEKKAADDKAKIDAEVESKVKIETEKKAKEEAAKSEEEVKKSEEVEEQESKESNEELNKINSKVDELVELVKENKPDTSANPQTVAKPKGVPVVNYGDDSKKSQSEIAQKLVDGLTK